MLAVTRDAAIVIRGIVHAAELPEDSGLRISVEEADEERVGLGLDVVPEPELHDQVVDALGANVFLDQEAAELLDGKVLDATLVDDTITFAIGDGAGDLNGRVDL
jgi:iron-sulfur cluster assembly protein